MSGIALLVYVVDPEVSKTWRLGVITSGIAMYSLPLALSFVYRFIEERLRIVDGVAVAPDRPGHGIAFDWKALETVRASR